MKEGGGAAEASQCKTDESLFRLQLITARYAQKALCKLLNLSTDDTVMSKDGFEPKTHNVDEMCVESTFCYRFMIANPMEMD